MKDTFNWIFLFVIVGLFAYMWIHPLITGIAPVANF